MRRALFALALLVACKPKVAKEQTAPDAAPVVIVVDAGSPPIVEAPLTWGTRPAEKGPLFPVVDGTCANAQIWPLKGAVLFTYGPTRGSATYARLEDDGLVRDAKLNAAVTTDDDKEWRSMTPSKIAGSWPDALFLHGQNAGAGRTRSFDSVWAYGEQGWSQVASYHEKGEPQYSVPAFSKGWLFSERDEMTASAEPDPITATIRTWPREKDAPSIPGLASLLRAGFFTRSFVTTDDSIYAFGYQRSDGAFSELLRVLTAGKVAETRGFFLEKIVGVRGNVLYATSADEKVRRVEGTKIEVLPFKLGPDDKIAGTGLAPNGDVWIVTSKNVVMVLHDGKVTATPLPAPKEKLPKEGDDELRSGALAGVEVDDPYATGENGALFHLENGEWHRVEMPTPPFATNGKYQARSLVVTEKGNLFVNAAYLEKGIGWKTPLRYRAVLRTKRPKEILRCNEPLGGLYSAGRDFMSSPPIADDSCATPFVVILRLGSKEQPNWLYDRGFPTVREAIKDTPALGQAELLEVPWGNSRVLGLRAPDMATAKAFALAVSKRVKNQFIETRPEIVCGVPPSAK